MRRYRVPEHTRYQVVEVVRDAAGQYVQAFEFLSMLDLRFEITPFLLGLLAVGRGRAKKPIRRSTTSQPYSKMIGYRTAEGNYTEMDRPPQPSWLRVDR
jgi:hypothetical protein